jgi:hypothetical protein
MTTLGGYYLNPHRTQFDGSPLERENCTPDAAANGANAATGGRVNKTGGQVRALIPRSQETDPSTPGWSIPDVDHAMAKLGVGFENRTGKGWAGLISALDTGHYAILQGDSDQFSNATCSGVFNGNHCIGIHPARRVVNGSTQHWINDGICKTGRWEYDYILRRYASKLAANIRFGVFTTAVPKAAAPAPATVTLRYGGVKLAKPVVKRIAVAAGTRANVRSRPTSTATKVTTLANGATFTAYQVTSTGQLLAGSRRWLGDRTGTRWLHATSF